MPVNIIEFAELEKKLVKTRKSPLEVLAPEFGKAYVIAITRDGCPACKRQKPRLDKLAASEAEKHGDKVLFTRVRVKYNPDSLQESLRSKDLLGHYFYPTNLILLRTRDRGAIEYYRNVSPTMSELKKNIENAIKIAGAMEKARK